MNISPEQDVSLGIFKDKFPVQWEILSLWKMAREHEEPTQEKISLSKVHSMLCMALVFWDQPLSGVEDRTKPREKSLFSLYFPR